MSDIDTSFFMVIVVLAVFGVLVDAAIIYGIFRFKKLEILSYVLLVNWAIASLLSIIIMPANIIMYYFLFTRTSHLSTCLTINATATFHIPVVLFGILLSLDWCINAYFPEISEKFRQYYSLTIGSTWLAVLVLYAFFTGSCLRSINYEVYNLITFVALYAINLLFVIALQGSKIIYKHKIHSSNNSDLLNGRLTTTTIVTCSYLIVIVSTVSEYFVSRRYRCLDYIYYCALPTVLAILVSLVATLVVLYQYDKIYQFSVLLFGYGLPEMVQSAGNKVKDSSSSTSSNSTQLSQSDQNVET